jgi:hypothetical protein
MAHLHSTLSLKKTGCKASQLLTSRWQLRSWKEQVKSGGCDIDKHNIINSLILNDFTAARANKTACYHSDITAMGNVSIFSFHISSVPLQGVLRVGEELQEKL